MSMFLSYKVAAVLIIFLFWAQASSLAPCWTHENELMAISPAPARATVAPFTRAFYMGMTPAEFDHTPASIEETYKIIYQSCDLVAHHLDEGIPWQESLEGKPYQANVENALKTRLQHLRPQQKVYIASTPCRGELADYWGKNDRMKREGKWKNKQMDDPEVIAAYTNFCRDLIRRFHPDFMAYAIEVNLDVKSDNAKSKAQWSKFVTMAKSVYTTLKAEYPKLPLFVTVQIDEFWKNEAFQRTIVREILPYTDYVAVSTYPYFYGYFDPKTIPSNWFSGVAALAPEKPFVVAETGFIAEKLNALGIKGPASPQWQNEYLNFLLTACNKLKAKFIVWFVPRDYDHFWDKAKLLAFIGIPVEIFKVWKDAGLQDGNGNLRPAYKTWLRWLRLRVASATE